MSLRYAPGMLVLCLFHGAQYRPAHILRMQDLEVGQRNVLTAIGGRHYLVSYCGLDCTWNEWVPGTSLKDCHHSSAGEVPEKPPNVSVASAESSSLNWETGMLERQRKYCQDMNLLLSTVYNQSLLLLTPILTSESFSLVPLRVLLHLHSSSSCSDRALLASSHLGLYSDKYPALALNVVIKHATMKLGFPQQLKYKLKNDEDTILNQRQLFELPRSMTVEKLLANFGNLIKSKSFLGAPTELTATVISGIQTYFDSSLYKLLLYPAERPQYDSIRRKYVVGLDISEQKVMSQIYGAEHLLRLITYLPHLVAYSTLDAGSTEIVQEYLNELLRFVIETGFSRVLRSSASWMLEEQSSLFQSSENI
ncbi:MRG-domain-containing protein [Favolaschia claudopus]|uniref:Chromatin modification-related protein EAF3 n=1 Tax=Favolaschia claudopus TaxID=2862362 RepID=A0AAV9ZI53_9AGAR